VAAVPSGPSWIPPPIIPIKKEIKNQTFVEELNEIGYCGRVNCRLSEYKLEKI
jgi:hypothetical protein